MIIFLACWLTGAMLFAYWFIYVIGNPLTKDVRDIDPGAIGAFIPRLLARRRLLSVGKFELMRMATLEDMKHTTDPIDRHALKRDFQRDVIHKGRELFTWERSILCPVCLHWWLTLAIVGSLFFTHWISTADLPIAGLIYLTNHFLIRKI